MAMQESRPYIYLVVTYFLTALLIRGRTALYRMLWALVFVEAFKALQGVYVYAQTRSWTISPEAVLGHEDAYFFTLYILLVAALWLFGVKGGCAPSRPGCCRSSSSRTSSTTAAPPGSCSAPGCS